MKQEQLIYNFNEKYRPSFNKSLFVRKDEDIINALRHVIYCIERNSAFTIKVLEFVHQSNAKFARIEVST